MLLNRKGPWTLMLTILVVAAVHAIPPHPRTRQMIRDGLIPEPYYLRHLEDLRRIGVNAPRDIYRRALQKDIYPSEAVPLATPANYWTGQLNALVILVDFPDSVHQTAAADFDSLLFDSTSASVRDYYRMVSYGTLDIITVDLPSQIGWTRADSAYSYYVNGENGLGIDAYPRNAQKLVEELVNAVDPFVDFSKYDNDGDHFRYVDALFIVHAGPGAEFTGSDDDIWSHAWSTHEVLNVDGVRVSPYTMEPEYWLSPGDMTIGVFAHELGHALFGLPDLYDRDESSNGIDDWSLMASGVWLGPLGAHSYMGTSPSNPDAWSRIQMGYAAPQNVTVDLIAEPVVNVSTSPDIYRLWTNGNASNEYFLVENRQRIGYDYYLPGDGLLVYHIDESITSQNDNEWYPGDTTSSHYLVAVEQADGAYNLEKGYWADAGDPFPGSSQNAAFYNFSNPSSRAYSGTHTGIFLTNISTSDDTIWVDMSVTPGQSAQITSISDVPDDQGGKVLVTWHASTDESHPQRPVMAYGIWLKDTGDGILLPSWPITTLEDGDWIQVGYTDSVGKTVYQWAAPTLVDSNHLGLNRSTFRIAACAADSLIISLSESFEGYSVDNLAPAIPQGLTAESSGGDGILLTWNANPDSDLAEYRIYRGESPDFLPLSSDSFLAATMDTTYHDTGLTPGQLYYRVLAVDVNGNTSEYSAVTDPVTVVAAEYANHYPTAFTLHPNYPNPFNPQTTIRFDVPQNSRIRMSIHDIRGREIARLVDGVLQPGYYAETWDGTSQSGHAVPSGLYIVRLSAPGMSQSIKMLLLK